MKPFFIVVVDHSRHMRMDLDQAAAAAQVDLSGQGAADILDSSVLDIDQDTVDDSQREVAVVDNFQALERHMAADIAVTPAAVDKHPSLEAVAVELVTTMCQS